MKYDNWNEHIGFTGWNCPIGRSQWDVDEYYDNAIDRIFLEWEGEEEEDEEEEEEVETP